MSDTNGHRYLTWTHAAVLSSVAIAVASGYSYHVDARLDRQKERLDQIAAEVVELIKGGSSGTAEDLGR